MTENQETARSKNDQTGNCQTVRRGARRSKPKCGDLWVTGTLMEPGTKSGRAVVSLSVHGPSTLCPGGMPVIHDLHAFAVEQQESPLHLQVAA